MSMQILTITVWLILASALGVIMWFFVWMLRELANNPHLPARSENLFSWPPTSRFDWLVVFTLFNVFGAWLYYLIEYRKNR